jgi:hypothetical protein
MGKITSGVDLFESQIDQLIELFPKFRRGTAENGVTIVQGELDIIDITGKLWETYHVEIHPCDGFPYRFPYVFETGGKIPRIADWHIYEATNSCCLAVDPEERLACRNGITLTAFVMDHVLPYFFNQTFRKIEGYYKNGEYSHGLKGVYEYYDSTLQTNGDIQETIRLMMIVADSVKPGRTHECFCGSKQKFRKCHRYAYEKLSMLGRSVLHTHAHHFAKAIREQ